MRLTWTSFKQLVQDWSLESEIRHAPKEVDYYPLLWVNFEGQMFELTDLKDPAEVSDFETNFLPSLVYRAHPRDTDGSMIMRAKTTRTGWHFEPRSLDFVTSKRASLYNRKHNSPTISGGSDIGDGILRFFDASGTELVQGELEADLVFQTRLTANCVMTTMDWEPAYDFDLVGVYFQLRNSTSNDSYLWIVVAPDVPENLGGSVPLANGGWNLSFFPDKCLFDADGKGVKSFYHDPVYHSSKIRVLVKHAVGEQLGIQMIYKHYKV